MAKKEKHYLIDIKTEKAVGVTYSANNAKRIVELNPKLIARDFVKDGQVNGRLPYMGKVATIKVLQHLFGDMYEKSPEGYTMTELQDRIAGATEISIITALSDMKNENYSGADPLFVKKVSGRYVRQEPNS